MQPIKELPMGFGMALLQNEKAMQCFNSLSPLQQKQIIEKTHNINSKAEMKALVQSIVQ